MRVDLQDHRRDGKAVEARRPGAADVPAGLPFLHPDPPTEDTSGEGQGDLHDLGFHAGEGGEAPVGSRPGAVLAHWQADLGFSGRRARQGVHPARPQATVSGSRPASSSQGPRAILYPALAFPGGAGRAEMVPASPGSRRRHEHLARGPHRLVRVVAVARGVGGRRASVCDPMGNRRVEMGRRVPTRRGVPGSHVGPGRNVTPHQYFGVPHGAPRSPRDGALATGASVFGVV
mmetsp:Transcript_18284/g.37075  ORF Transcript_18284/g.37075 Transcript_18284/m.37075 type:complete len:232 (+) Transcript_18284:1303-1998(+)